MSKKKEYIQDILKETPNLDINSQKIIARLIYADNKNAISENKGCLFIELRNLSENLIEKIYNLVKNIIKTKNKNAIQPNIGTF
jgi:hypothetical protein